MSSCVSSRSYREFAGFATFFWNKYRAGDYTDVEILLQSSDGQKTYSLHKLVLCLRSPYFADMFYENGGDPKAVSNIIPLANVNPEAFENMIRYMYDYTPEIRTPRQACELYILADRFQMISLMDFCHGFLSKAEILPSNVLNFLEVSEGMQNRSLRDRCMNLIQEKTEKVMTSYDLLEITPSMIHIFLDSPRLSLESEYQLLLWIFAWAAAKCGAENSRYETTREVLEKFLPDLYFLCLTNVEFALFYRDHKNFFRRDEVISIFMNIAIPGSREMPDWYDKDRRRREYSGSK